MIFSHRKTISHLTTLAVLLSFLCGISSGMTLTAGPGLPAPDLALDTLDGQTVNLSLLKGQNALLLFGATWCPHCRTALGTLENIYESAGDDLLVFFVAVGQNADELNDYFGDAIPPYLILPDENADLSSLFGIKRIPVCTFIDEAGTIRHKGRFDETIVRRLLSGERLTYPRRSPDAPPAPGRLMQRPDAPPAAIKRYFVELDEDPGLAKRLSKAAIDLRRSEFRRAAEPIGARIIHNYGKLDNRIVVEISPDQTDKLKQLPRFKKFEEDTRVHAMLEDSVYQIEADYAWNNAITGKGIKVCVVDTGIDYTHQDLAGKVIAQYDVTTDTQDAMDDHGHGTHCAGIIASEGTQYRGVSHDVSLMAAKVLDYNGSGYTSDVILGIRWCVEQGADVISLSLGASLYSGTCDFDSTAQAANDAVDAGVVVACAAGNDSDRNHMITPACASKVIAVGAVDKVDEVAYYSNGGTELDLVAPGGVADFGGTNYPDIVSAFSTEVANNPMYCFHFDGRDCLDDQYIVEGTRYIRAMGTSMATPHVAAAAALLLEENPTLTPAQVKSLLEENADDLGDPGWDNTYGWGRINLERALDNVPPKPGELTVQITEPNAAERFIVSEQFTLIAEIECFGEEGCGDVLAYAEFCSGRDCDDFVDINSVTTISTPDNNPNNVGIISSARADWTLTANTYGDFTLRVRTDSNTPVVGGSDARVISVYDPNLPVVESIDCMIDSAWGDCSEAKYGDTLQKIRANAFDPQEIPDVRLTITNVPDDHNFVDELMTYSEGYFLHDSNLAISDSGQWRINVVASDSDGNTDAEMVTWNVPWGILAGRLISPPADITVPKSGTFDIRAGARCLNAECPNVTFTLQMNDPNELIYDDYTPEDYGDIGSTDGYLAVKFTPSAYPAELITARFYVWDQTTYPFELNAWDDNGRDWLGGSGAPGTPLMPPMLVDPVAPSFSGTNMDVAWFDIDLSDQDIVIDNGSFYIGCRQIEEGKLNQIGFDMSGDSYQPYTRSWGLLPGWGWLNLNDMCSYSPEFCGNLMIRAMMLESGAYSGELPTIIGSAPFYTSDEYPKPCSNADLNPGQACQVTLAVHAVGSPGDYTQFQAVSANNYALDTTGSVKVTIAQPLTPCDAANLNAVYPVNYRDFAALANQWQQTPDILIADIDGDGKIDFKDVAQLADYWLNTCQ